MELICKQVPEFARHPVVGHEQPVVVAQADEVPIEQPMASGGECDAVPHDVRAPVVHRPDVRRLNLRLPPPPPLMIRSPVTAHVSSYASTYSHDAVRVGDGAGGGLAELEVIPAVSPLIVPSKQALPHVAAILVVDPNVMALPIFIGVVPCFAWLGTQCFHASVSRNVGGHMPRVVPDAVQQAGLAFHHPVKAHEVQTGYPQHPPLPRLAGASARSGSTGHRSATRSPQGGDDRALSASRARFGARRVHAAYITGSLRRFRSAQVNEADPDGQTDIRVFDTGGV